MINRIARDFKNVTAQERGFSALEGSLIVAVVILVIAAGWLVYHQHTNAYHKATTSRSSATSTTRTKPKTYTYPGQRFTITYPANWMSTTQSMANEFSVSGAPLPQVVRLTPPNAPRIYSGNTFVIRNSVGITVYKTSSTQDAVNRAVYAKKILQNQNLTINGYPAIFCQVGPPLEQGILPSSYTDDVYAVTHNNITVVFFFRLNESATSAVPATDGPAIPATPAFDVTSLLPIFKSIVISIRFPS